MESLITLALIVGVLLGLRDEYKRRRAERERRRRRLPEMSSVSPGPPFVGTDADGNRGEGSPPLSRNVETPVSRR